MELNWDNLMELFKYARDTDQFDSPYVHISDDDMCIDGSINKATVERFVQQAQQEPPR